MPIVNCITDLWWLFYNVYETLTLIVSNLYLFYVSFAGLVLEGAGLGLGLALGSDTAGLVYKTAVSSLFRVRRTCRAFV